MPNILDSIQVSGASYDIKDKNAPSVSAVTQQEYDNLPSSAKTSNTFFVITDAEAGDLTNYYTKSETNTLLDGKQATLVSGTNIKTINNESILGSGNIDIQGGSTYTAGRGISIANDAISVSLPISAGTGSNSIIEGNGTKASGFSSHAEGSYSNARGSYSHAEGFGANANGASSHAEGGATNADGSYSHAEGDTTTAKGNYSHTEGRNTIANNLVEHASGQYNVSSSASTTFGDSGNTLFSVGNGTADNARHNAFEIRQNGDIYLTKDGQDVKLQDQLGGGGITSGEVETMISAATSGYTARFDEDEEVTAAGLNALNESLSGKQDTLIAGDNITISGNVISASGGGSITIDSGITSGSTNAVENGAIWSATTYNKEVTLEFDDSNMHYSTNFPSGCTTVKATVPNGSGYMYVYFYSGSTNTQLGLVYIEKYGSTPSVTLNFTDASYTIENNDVIITYPSSKGVNKVRADNNLEGAIVKAVVEGAWVNENTYMSVEVDSKIKALDDKKLDATAYTPTVVDSQLNAASTNPVQNQALYDELVIEGAETETTLTFTGTSYNYQSTNYPSGCTKVKISNVPNNNNDIIYFYSSSQQLGYASINNFGTLSVSLSFNGASYSIVDGVVVITYPTVSNVSYIKKNQDATTVKAVTTPTTHLIDQVTANTTSIATKQDILSAGTGIDITDNVISVTGGSGGGVPESTFSAYTAATDSRLSEDEEVTAAALNTLNDALGGMKLVKLTQTEYDNLSTKDSNTLYVING